MSIETKQKIAEMCIIWLKSSKEVAEELNMPRIYIHNFIKSREYKEYERKWVYKKVLTQHQDLFIDCEEVEDPDRLLDF